MRMTSNALVLSAVCAAALALAPASPGQQSEDKKPHDDQKASAGSGQSRESMETQTIHGIVAAITTEGEIALDYKNKKAVEIEAAFMTVVGTPVHHEKSAAGGSGGRADEGQKHNAAGHHRYNVYQVWLSPKTKICECEADMAKGSQSQTTSSSDSKECSLDKLEVGDHIQIEFVTHRDASESRLAHQTEQMRQKHGRHRTHVGYAKAVTIMVPKDMAQADQKGSKDRDEKSGSKDQGERRRSRDRD